MHCIWFLHISILLNPTAKTPLQFHKPLSLLVFNLQLLLIPKSIMLLKISPSLSASSPNLPWKSFHLTRRLIGLERHGVAMAKGSAGGAITGVIFSPFEELKHKPEVALIPVEADKSLARYKYSEKSQAAVNEQIKCV